jgi:hypothetical protein
MNRHLSTSADNTYQPRLVREARLVHGLSHWFSKLCPTCPNRPIYICNSNTE